MRWVLTYTELKTGSSKEILSANVLKDKFRDKIAGDITPLLGGFGDRLTVDN
jgi:hypothetical protein